jgi:methylated-DNA-protein-cysteine methyltransferase related protein
MLAVIRSVVRRIPKGRVATYGSVAAAAGYEGAARQVSWALHNCGPDVPWHRVLGAGGRILLGGHAGTEQRLLLETEGVYFRGGRVPLPEFGHHFSGTPEAVERVGAAESGVEGERGSPLVASPSPRKAKGDGRRRGRASRPESRLS